MNIMTITLRPDQERLINEAIDSGVIGSVDELIDRAIEALPHRETETTREAAIRQMREFGDRYKLNLGEPITRKWLHEGHRF